MFLKNVEANFLIKISDLCLIIFWINDILDGPKCNFGATCIIKSRKIWYVEFVKFEVIYVSFCFSFVCLFDFVVLLRFALFFDFIYFLFFLFQLYFFLIHILFHFFHNCFFSFIFYHQIIILCLEFSWNSNFVFIMCRSIVVVIRLRIPTVAVEKMQVFLIVTESVIWIWLLKCCRNRNFYYMFFFMLYKVLFLLYISYILCFVKYLFCIYKYIKCFLFLLHISIVW